MAGRDGTAPTKKGFTTLCPTAKREALVSFFAYFQVPLWVFVLKN